ncbi:MAG: hypothetical protein ACTSQY_06220 [Candidatus Odinarchaeia archaeon]
MATHTTEITLSKKVAIIAVMGAIVGILEIFPIPFLTDIPFPPFPKLTFDITGVPIIITYLLIGFMPALSVIAMMGVFIGYRNIFGSIFKVIAELATLIGFALVFKYASKSENKYLQYGTAIIAGVGLRVLVMHISNYFLLPIFYGIPVDAVVAMLIFIDVFNAIQGTINIGLGIAIDKIIVKTNILNEN